MNQFVPYTIMTLAVVIGGGSLLLFGTFLLIGPISIITLNAPEFQVLFWDGLLYPLLHSAQRNDTYIVS